MASKSNVNFLRHLMIHSIIPQDNASSNDFMGNWFGKYPFSLLQSPRPLNHVDIWIPLFFAILWWQSQSANRPGVGVNWGNRFTLYVAQTRYLWNSSIFVPKMRRRCQVVLKAVQTHRIPAFLSKHIILPFFEKSPPYWFSFCDKHTYKLRWTWETVSQYQQKVSWGL